MPEGDTVWRTARHLDRALSGHDLTATDFRVPALATTDLRGERVVETVARGKHLLTRVGAGLTVHTRLKMEGSWHLYRPGAPWRRPAHEARLVLDTDDWTAVGFALGIVELVARDQEHAAVGHLGPDLLAADWDAGVAAANLAADEREIGVAMLDQRHIAGLGTVYRAETLFLAGQSPFLGAADIADLGRLVGLARRLMLANLDNPLQVTTGISRRGRQHWVYGRGGEPCRRCGTLVRSAMQGQPPQDRVVFWCPSCQPG